MPRGLLILFTGMIITGAVRADVFDRYSNSVLKSLVASKDVLAGPRISAAQLAQSASVIPGSNAALVIVRTNEGRFAKMAVQLARQRSSKGPIPILVIDRYVTYKPGEEHALQATGRNVHLYGGFMLDLDIGQIVPPEVGGDVRFSIDNGQQSLGAVGKAKLFLVTRPLAENQDKTGRRLDGPFEASFFNGQYRLYDDGRRTARLVIKVGDDGQVTGQYISDRTGRTYEVSGRLGRPRHVIDFTVKFPQTEQTFHGWMFTHGGRAMAGSCRMQNREFGWYAVRIGDE